MEYAHTLSVRREFRRAFRYAAVQSIPESLHRCEDFLCDVYSPVPNIDFFCVFYAFERILRHRRNELFLICQLFSFKK